MLKKTRIKLATLSISLVIGIALSSTVHAQANASAGTSQPTAGACDESKEAALACLDKVLDAYEKAQAVIAAKDAEIKAKDEREALRIQIEQVKDEMNALYKADNERMRKELHKTKWQKFFDRAEKWGVFAAGLAIGSGL